jgi:hypothetical protein
MDKLNSQLYIWTSFNDIIMGDFMFDLASEFVRSTSAPIYLTGKAGTGKTTFLRTVVPACGKKYVIAAPTGVAAINAGGVTLHSLFGFPTKAFVPSDEAVDPNIANNTLMLMRHFKYNRQKREMLRELELLVIDEVSMVRMDIMDAIDLALRTVRRSSLPFGGVQVLLIGDLYQLPPVIREDEIRLLSSCYQGRYFFDALVYPKIKPVMLELEVVHRQTDRKFVGILNNIRNTEFDRDDYDALMQYYRPDFQPEEGAGFITLTTHNSTADKLNEESLKRIAGEERYLIAAIHKEFPENMYPTESALRVKVGAQVMFIKNDTSMDKRYFNGKIGIISAINNDNIDVRFTETNTTISVKPETWENKRYLLNKSGDKLEEEVMGSFVQYPIRLAWAITIHKSQGLTFDKAVIDAGASFAAGQVYVALSRCRSMDGLVLKSEITSRSIQSDARIVAFSAVKIGRAALEDRLWTEQQQYAKTRLLRVFSFREPERQMRDWHLENKEFESPLPVQVADQAEEWASRLMELEEIAARFRSEILQIFPDDFDNENQFNLLVARITKGADYFAGRLHEQVIQPLAEFHGSLAVRSRAKKYFLQADTLLERLWVVLNNLYGMQVNGQWLYQGVNKIVREPLSDAPTPAESAEKKAVKGETYTITLNLFREGHAIDDIAEMRKMSPTTIETHLATLLSQGKINIDEVLTADQQTEILQAIKQTSKLGLTEIKAKLSDNYTYGMIKWALNAKLHEA